MELQALHGELHWEPPHLPPSLHATRPSAPARRPAMLPFLYLAHETCTNVCPKNFFAKSEDGVGLEDGVLQCTYVTHIRVRVGPRGQSSFGHSRPSIPVS
ncbi:hypothetical protein MCOR02_002771 [Pyricularia oryzae]|nr:hypothetical protein MCOR02_002771 [Pyricularia oryzae]